MKIRSQIINIDIETDIKEFSSITEFRKYLNSCLYYCEEVVLKSSFDNFTTYSKGIEISSIMSDSVKYGDGYIEIYIFYE